MFRALKWLYPGMRVTRWIAVILLGVLLACLGAMALIFGLLASSIVTWVMARFEHALSANVAVAFFVPALVYIAGAMGTQAVSASVRGLSPA